MIRYPSLLCAACLVSALGVAMPVAAQTVDPTPTVFRLLENTTFQRGCFPPCICPLMEPVPAEGTFLLEPLGFDGLFHQFLVSGVNWTVSAPELSITGSGTYRVGGEFASQHQLMLELQVGEEPLQHFDSGLVAGGSSFPIFDIVVSVNQMYCYDTVLDLHAAPALQIDIDDGAVSREPDSGRRELVARSWFYVLSDSRRVDP